MSISEVSFSSLRSLEVGGVRADPTSPGCGSNCSFDSIMNSVSASSGAEGQSALTLHDGTSVSLQGNGDLGQTLLSSVLTVKSEGLSRAESYQQKLDDLKSVKMEKTDDFAAASEKQQEFSLKMIDLQAQQSSDRMITVFQTTSIKKSGEGVQQLVKG